ncbi:MAG: response regulator transcription factor [Tepidisphaerales bacterium]
MFVVDDDAGVRGLLATNIETEGYRVRQFTSAEGFLAGYDGKERGCVLLDMRLEGMSGIELLERLRSRHIGIPVIIISAFGDVPAAVRSMQLGAVDFIEKPFDCQALLGKIAAALQQDAPRRHHQAEVEAANQRLSLLSPRELDLLKGLMEGKSSKVIAAELGITLRTVEKHRSNILAKTGAINTPDLVRLATIAGLG